MDRTVSRFLTALFIGCALVAVWAKADAAPTAAPASPTQHSVGAE